MKCKTLQTVRARAAIVLVLAATAATALLFAKTPALAGKTNPNEFSRPLDNVGDEPRAKGTFTAKWGVVVAPNGEPVSYWTGFHVSCTKLTPGASYVLYVDYVEVPFVADRHGAAQTGTLFQGEYWYDPHGSSLRVYRVDDGADPVLVLAFPRP